MTNPSQIKDWLLLLVPLVVIQLTLQIAAIVSLLKRDNNQIRWNNKLIWILIIILGELIGPILYFVIGRIEGEPGDSVGD
jgi:hypothetical protein